MQLPAAILEVWNHSGLAALWNTIAPWLALDARQLIFLIATPFFIGTVLWEYTRIKHDPKLMDAREAVRNFMLGAGYQTTELLFAGIISFPVFALAYHYRLMDIPLNVFTGALLVVALDFSMYWMHRAEHRVRWFWCAHVTHHSSERMNFSTAMRQNATNIFNGSWLFLVPLAFIGFNPVWIGVCFALNLVYQFFVHSTLVPKLHPVIEYIFNTPSHHRVHHGHNQGYVDTNYGGMIILWDRMFGTFALELDDKPVKYGIPRHVETTSLIKSWTHEYVDMFGDICKTGSIGLRLKHLWMPPAWQRDATELDMKHEAQAGR